ncbi:hypothetical protein K2173_020231 [Erythroxylum novogranatense]|uniref:Uncharacterized protein n=1 Tax=Erythroxylum novogranatense TaxID=1862640 RepID=A0AAV8U7F0_9ROSI|nr:hypothetical protein K2173_020231 [Erythroxylum novogranatense]
MVGWGASDKGLRKGPWTHEEDELLSEYVKLHGEGRWSSVARCSGLSRSGKSCRLRWVNYLRPGLKRGQITPQEEGIIIELHALWGNKWSTIARYLPGRTDNEIKNYWRTHFKNKDKSPEKQEKRKGSRLKQKPENQESEEDSKRVDVNVQEQPGMQEMSFMYPILWDQYLSVMSQNVAPWADFTADDGLYGGLWNLDVEQQHGGADYHGTNGNKMAMQHQTTSFGDPNNHFYGGGYTLRV